MGTNWHPRLQTLYNFALIVRSDQKMGKKESKKRGRSDSEDLEEENADLDLDAEMAALASMRAEKEMEESGDDVTDIDSGPVKTKKMYNREGILQAIESIGTLPFIESYQISEFSADIHDEHDDLEREVDNPEVYPCSFLVTIFNLTNILNGCNPLDISVFCTSGIPIFGLEQYDMRCCSYQK